MSAPVWALILAGGQSRRMGSDKALQTWDGRPATLRLRDLAMGVCEGTMLSRAPGQDLPEGWTESDTIRDRGTASGPLRGILSAMEAIPDRAWLVVACDQPLLSRELLATLLEERDPSKVATSFLDSDGRFPDPMCTLYEPAFAQAAVPWIDHPKGCPRKVLLNAPVKVLPSPGGVLRDADSPAERLVLAGLLGGSATVTIDYYAILRERTGLASETITTTAPDLAALWEDVRSRHALPFERTAFGAACNDEFAPWDAPLADGDRVAFLPPVSGG